MKAALAALALVAACGGESIDPLALAVDERGPFSVGYQTLAVSYQQPGTDAPREIEVSVWYPTEDTEGYAPTYAGLFRDDDAFEDAAPAPPIHAGGYPVHVYSHGDRGFAGTSADLMGYFASHGWVAVAPTHTGNTILDSDRDDAIYYQRSLDVTAALDALAGVTLAGPIAADRVVLSGHSFGAYTTWASAGAAFDEAEVQARCDACSDGEIEVLMSGLHDDRVVAAIPMAGGDSGWFGADGYAAVDVPVLYMTGTDDDVGQQALYDAIAGVDLTWIDIEGGCHQVFALGGCDDIATDEGFAIVNTYALAFARHWLLDDAGVDGILDGSTPVSDRVQFSKK